MWSPPRYEQRYGYLFGGLGAGNTDGEWSDREHRAVPTLADYFVVTGEIEYIERAVAATRASFGLMHMPPNFQYNITRQPAGNGPPAGRGEVGCVAAPTCVNQFGLDAVPACEPAATAPSASYGLEVV